MDKQKPVIKKAANKPLSPVQVHCLLTEFDIHLFREGRHYKLYEKLGSHPITLNRRKGVYFAVWAPAASKVCVSGNFNFWNRDSHPLHVRWDGSGIWEGFIPGVGHGEIYKYIITNADSGEVMEKFDPFARRHEPAPATASQVWKGDYKWKDKKWMKQRSSSPAQPLSIYELHFGSWRRNLDESNSSLSYAEMAQQLVDYIKELQFTHVEFLPLTEHPFYGSWGYQSVGFFAPTARYGTPEELMFLVDLLHQHNFGVLFDWVPSHFPEDAYALARYDGSCLFEYEDPRKGYHPDWKSLIFNYSRYEVRSFLISSAMFWLDAFHADGLRVDAVASMLYLDYSRKQGEWEPNVYGGNENIEAISFLKELNQTISSHHPDVLMIAEESTAWPGVTRSVKDDGLGFGFKWMMGWMHDTLEYFKKEPVYRSYHQNQITFSLNYAFSEKYVLPLSHDEVVHGKGSLISRMPGDSWQQFANLRLLYSYMFTHPGAKMLFMGAEFAQFAEWNHDQSLDWHLLEFAPHRSIQHLVKKLNQLYRSEASLYEKQFSHDGFEWIDLNDAHNSVLIYIRKGNHDEDHLITVLNFTPVVRSNYRMGVPANLSYQEVFNSDAAEFGGSHVTNPLLKAEAIGIHGRPFSVSLTLPPLAAVVLKPVKHK
jgi:1,4-alpha-glucan branching enzyme